MANNKFLEETGLARFWSHVKKLVSDNAYRPNLLINGDFQCWQRKDSFLVNNTIQPICDMWKMWGNGNYGVSKVSTDAGKGTGLTWNNNVGSLIYILPDETFNSLNGKKITITYSKNKTVYTYQTITVSQKKIIDYDFKLAVGDVLNWVRADEGSIAYPHVKEDYALALSRCRMFIKKQTFPAHVVYKYSDRNQFRIFFDIPFRSIPTISFDWGGYTNVSGSWQSISEIKNINAETNLVTFDAVSPDIPSGVSSIETSFIASVEPL